MQPNKSVDQCQSEQRVVSCDELADELAGRTRSLGDGQRLVVGIVGFPGAGKSTTAASLVTAINAKESRHPAIGVPMDGFHLSNEELEKLGLLPLKGIPDTFDASGFVDLLQRLKTSPKKTVCCPLFDRSIEASIPDAIRIEPHHKLCIVEGNYLLLQSQPWDACRRWLDEVFFLDVTIETILPRLWARHEAGGKSPEQARAKVDSTDLPNARLIEQTKRFADRLIRI